MDRPTGLAASDLILEVTESALIDVNVAGAALDRLRALGVQLALDDFGTGYSALGYLAQLPFHIVKIDKSFVAGIGHKGRVDTLLENVLGLCTALELEAIAEGVEEPLQLHRLRELGCRVGQGYLFARPVPSSEFVQLMGSSQLGGVAPGLIADVTLPVPLRDPEHQGRAAGAVGGRRPRRRSTQPAPARVQIH